MIESNKSSQKKREASEKREYTTKMNINAFGMGIITIDPEALRILEAKDGEVVKVVFKRSDGT